MANVTVIIAILYYIIMVYLFLMETQRKYGLYFNKHIVFACFSDHIEMSVPVDNSVN